jgi:ribosomal protein S18 acetylase RimI-like enzyme
MMPGSDEMTLRVDVARPADVEALVSLVNGAYRGESSRAGWTTEADFLDGQRIDREGMTALIAGSEGAVLVLREGETPIACCYVMRQLENVAYVGMIVVRPTLQRAGLGRRVLAEAERFAKERLQATRMRMTVISLREALLSWYERRGYRLTGEREPFPSHDPRFGLPKRPDLEFVVLERAL